MDERSERTPAEVAWGYFAHLSAGELDEAAALLADEGSWWTCGSRRAVPMAEHKVLFRQVLAAVPMRFTHVATHVAGDRVILEAESHAPLPDGGELHNVYAFIVTVEDGRIAHVREYDDTATLAEMAPRLRTFYADGA